MTSLISAIHNQVWPTFSWPWKFLRIFHDKGLSAIMSKTVDSSFKKTVSSMDSKSKCLRKSIDLGIKGREMSLQISSHIALCIYSTVVTSPYYSSPKCYPHSLLVLSKYLIQALHLAVNFLLAEVNRDFYFMLNMSLKKFPARADQRLRGC